MALAKLQVTVEHTGEVIFLPFNPEEYTLNQDNTFASQAIPGLSGPILQFVNGNMHTLEMELFFDTWDTDSLREARTSAMLTDKVTRSARDRPGSARAAGASGAMGQSRLPLCAGAGEPEVPDVRRQRPPGPRPRHRDLQPLHRRRARGQGDQPPDRRLQQGPRRHRRRDAERRSPHSTTRIRRLWRPIALANALDDPRAIARRSVAADPIAAVQRPGDGTRSVR